MEDDHIGDFVFGRGLDFLLNTATNQHGKYIIEKCL